MSIKRLQEAWYPSSKKGTFHSWFARQLVKGNAFARKRATRYIKRPGGWKMLGFGFAILYLYLYLLALFCLTGMKLVDKTPWPFSL